jgi:hypothetical protein
VTLSRKKKGNRRGPRFVFFLPERHDRFFPKDGLTPFFTGSSAAVLLQPPLSQSFNRMHTLVLGCAACYSEENPQIVSRLAIASSYFRDAARVLLCCVTLFGCDIGALYSQD